MARTTEASPAGETSPRNVSVTIGASSSNIEPAEASTSEANSPAKVPAVLPPPAEAKPATEGEGLPQEECRICLMNDDIAELVKPCHCIGSVQYAHLKCLKLWVHERLDLHCEICKSMYEDDLLPELQPILIAGLEEQARRRSRGYATQAEIARIASRRGLETLNDPEDSFCLPKGLWVRVLVLTGGIGAMVGLLLFLGLSAGDETWAAVLLRVLAFMIPALVVLRALASCWKAARASSRDAQEVERNNRREPTALADPPV